MSMTAGLLNLTLGLVYLGIGTIVAIDLEKDIRRRGYSHFGVSWLTIMYTCGFHHLVHGVHLAAEGRQIGWLDTIAVASGLPAGIIWSALRIEAVRGGRGDRFIRGTPAWLRRLAWAYGIGAILASGVAMVVLANGVHSDTRLLPNVLLVVLYIGIGAVLLRGQLGNREDLGGWSVSGLSLMMVFPTCALMHAVYIVYTATGAFAPDYHGLWADWVSVPAALYFFWVVRGLETGTLKDWNDRFESIEDLSPTALQRVGARR